MNTTGIQKSITVAQVLPKATVFPILLSISFSHLLNDSIQSLIPSIYPDCKKNIPV